MKDISAPGKKPPVIQLSMGVSIGKVNRNCSPMSGSHIWRPEKTSVQYSLIYRRLSTLSPIVLSWLNCIHCILHWLCSYLTSREQKVVIEGASSGVQPVISGVPQGSVLGQYLLFLVYIDDVMRVNFHTDSAVCRWWTVLSVRLELMLSSDLS